MHVEKEIVPACNKISESPLRENQFPFNPSTRPVSKESSLRSNPSTSAHRSHPFVSSHRSNPSTSSHRSNHFHQLRQIKPF
ncbi:hypothetical protein DPMN_087824 [Dreissena polymorpha]|uniref:Uncharacterized protein n=1 Tax=Dreissena polymorpha TaxID=45954 RepID=A0A9D4KT12_DREPO|nr:hypothetical protein DPMN_087824 [Dreissena polymorpha]